MEEIIVAVICWLTLENKSYSYLFEFKLLGCSVSRYSECASLIVIAENYWWTDILVVWLEDLEASVLPNF